MSIAYIDKMNRKVAMWKKGRHTVLTVDNPDKTQTNMREFRVPARSWWGSPNPPKKEDKKK